MSRIRRTVIHQTMVAGFIALGLVATAVAQNAAPATGLGQAWPNAKDHSRSPYWHVYVFERDGVRYVQINDRQGVVHAALGRAGDTVFALPVGVDAEDVTIMPSARGSVSALPIYQDEAMRVIAVTQGDGTSQIIVNAICGDPSGCTGGKATVQ